MKFIRHFGSLALNWAPGIEQTIALVLMLGLMVSTNISANQPSKYDDLAMAQLLLKTESGSSVRILVTLNLDEFSTITPELIADTQAKLLAELSEYSIENIKAYGFIPELALTVGHVALTTLIASPLVKYVTPNGLVHTMSIPVSSTQGQPLRTEGVLLRK